jgi:diketogulonate reductase-like aldo/keto reductase
MPDVSTLPLDNGVVMPAIGFGVFQTNRSEVFLETKIWISDYG